jgi:hypothetical protein
MKKLFILAVACLQFFYSLSQVAINNDGTPPHPSAMLDVKSANKGTLITRMTSAQRKGIVNPAVGLLVFDTDQKTLYMYDGNRWMGFVPIQDDSRPVKNVTFTPGTEDTTLSGYSVSMWDQFAAISAPYKKNGAANYSGAVYMYKKNANGWDYFSTLTPTSGSIDSAYYGMSVNICGNYMIVGAYNHKNASNQRTGAAYIYYYNGSAWVHTHTLYGTFATTGFGMVVDINQYGTYVAVSEPFVNSGVNAAGAVRVYNLQNGNYIFQQYLLDPSPAANENFGTAMAMSPTGDYVLVGAPRKLVGGMPSTGYIGLFRRSGAVWNQFQTVTQPGSTDLRLGAYVDCSDNTALFAYQGSGQVYANAIPASGTWFGYTYPPFPGVKGVAIDPVSGWSYVYAGNDIHEHTDHDSKRKTIAGNTSTFQSLRPFAIYGEQYAVGLPGTEGLGGSLVGAVYFGKLQ